jgi:5'-deoxynucleotidase YfbR-like HD superfamily hydrolase
MRGSDWRAGDWFLSHTGRKIYPFDLRPEDVDIDDIAHSLSNLCRFNGHCDTFYSVAQHSVLVSRILHGEGKELQKIGLLHDATEAYCGDMISPIKRAMGEFKYMEDRQWIAISHCFHLPERISSRVKEADMEALITEKRDLFRKHGDAHPWKPYDVKPLDDIEIIPLSQIDSKALFMKEFEELFGGRD